MKKGNSFVYPSGNCILKFIAEQQTPSNEKDFFKKITPCALNIIPLERDGERVCLRKLVLLFIE